MEGPSRSRVIYLFSFTKNLTSLSGFPPKSQTWKRWFSKRGGLKLSLVSVNGACPVDIYCKLLPGDVATKILETSLSKYLLILEMTNHVRNTTNYNLIQMKIPCIRFPTVAFLGYIPIWLANNNHSKPLLLWMRLIMRAFNLDKSWNNDFLVTLQEKEVM